MAARDRSAEDEAGGAALAAARRRRGRSIALAVALAAMAALFYAVTIAKLGPQILQRAL